MTHASICSGLDGPALAAAWLGWENLFHADINEFTNRILKYFYPNATQYTDIRKTSFLEWRGKIDVLSAGFPCQPFSVAGGRQGAADDRYLWDETYRIVDEVRPTWFLGENVNGITSMVFPGEEVKVGTQADLFGAEAPVYESVGQYIIDRICRDLEEIGYEVIPIVIPACAVGAPHERMRCFFLAHRTNAGTEDVQGSEDGVLSAEVTSNPTGLEDYRRRPGGFQPEPSGAATERVASLPDGERRQECDPTTEPSQPVQPSGGISEGDVADTTSCGWVQNDESKCSRQHSQEIPHWQDFPTQPPVCSGNDGLSAGLDGITFPKWRNESIKAYGNAIVPQVAYQIFKAINECERTTK